MLVSNIKREDNSYIWTIQNFNLFDQYHKVWPHDSPCFQYACSDIKCQLSISDDINFLYVKLQLYGCSDVDLFKSFHVTMINKEKTNIKSNYSNLLVNTSDEFLPTYTKTLSCCFVKESRFMKSDSILTIKCQIDGFTNDCHEIEKHINTDYEELFLSAKFSDVTFLIDGKSIKAHKNILSARSTVFDAMFQHDMVENNKNIVEIKDFNFEVMLEFLRFLYCGKIKKLEVNVLLLIVAADKYNVKDLKKLCGHFIFKKLTIENACDTLNISDFCNNTLLKNKTIEYIAKNIKQIILTPGFKRLTDSKPHLLVEVLIYTAK